jgi:sugar phosphate permease
MALDKGAKTPALAQNTTGETTPLLNNLDAIDRSDTASIDSSKSPKTTEPPSPDVRQPEEEKPFPFWQILILCYASIVEPMAFFIIFPYVNEMVERIGHQKPENVGFWTGSIESLFSIVQMLLIIFYGRLADRLGRKPVLVFSLAGIAAASALFGMSSSLPQMIVFRCTAGLFAGSSVTIRAMLSENCTKKTQGKAFAWFMFARYFYRSSQTRAITLTKCLDNLEFL